MTDPQRERLIMRIRQLPAEKLARVDELLTHLERGDETVAPAPGVSNSGEPAAQMLRSPHSTICVKNESGDRAPTQRVVPDSKDWPHAPLHRLSERGTYIVTAGTLHKEHWFRRPECLDLLETTLLRLAKQFGWQLEAWAVFSNRYHFLAHSQEGAEDLRDLLKQLHGETSRELNRLDGVTGRSVWHNFWDTELTFEKSYLARLNYVHQNAVKHGLVPVANHYRWCSAAWFERTATPAQVKTIYGFKTDKVQVHDDFEVLECGKTHYAGSRSPL